MCGLYVLVATLTATNLISANNVCLNYKDYKDVKKNSNCWNNSDVYLNAKQRIAKYGYNFEEHVVVSSDGYFINLLRIPNGGDNDTNRIVLLHPGLSADSAFFLVMGEQSIPFIFSNDGYDVWIINTRGTQLSQKHQSYTIYDRKYWDFSYYESGYYDLPAIIDFINNKRKRQGAFTYVGHSMGTSVSFVYASLHSEHAKKNLKSIIALAPVTSSSNSLDWFLTSLAPVRLTILHRLGKIGIHGISPHVDDTLKRARQFCSSFPGVSICSFFLDLVSGFNEAELLPKTYPVLWASYPTAFSIKQAIHLMQSFSPGNKFQMFDYGLTGNLKRYFKPTPPSYPLHKIRVPVHIYYGENDMFASKKDAYVLYRRLKGDKFITKVPHWGHLNFAAATDAPDLYKNLTKL